MLIVTLRIKTPPGHDEQAVKELLAMALEPLGRVEVVEIKADEAEQIKMEV